MKILPFAAAALLLAIATPANAQSTVDSLIKSASEKYESKDFTGAIADYTKLIAIAPKNADLYFNRGLAKDESGDFAGAVADYSKAIEISPDSNADFYNNRGKSQASLRNHTNALGDFDKAIKLNPKLARAFFNRGNTKLTMKNYAEAIADYDKCITLDPKHSLAHDGRGLAEYNLRRWRSALESYRKSRELNPDQDDYSKFRIWALRSRLGESDAATEELATHVHSLQGSARTEWTAQIGRFLIGEITETEFIRLAETSARTAKDKSGQLCEANFYAGLKQLLTGHKSEAVSLFQKCLDTGVKTYGEFNSAEAELEALKKP